MKQKFNKKLVWLLLLCSILCLAPAAYVLAKTVEAQEAETVFFYVADADNKDVLVKAAPIDEIRNLSHPMSDGGPNYGFSYTDNLPTTGYGEALGFTTDELIAYLNQNAGYKMGTLTYQGNDRLYFMADDSGTNYTRSYTAAKLNGVERRYVPGLYEGWQRYYDAPLQQGDDQTWEVDDVEDLDPDTKTYKEQAWSDGEVMPALLSTLSDSGRTTTNVSETSDGILDYVVQNGNVIRGCLRNTLGTDKAITLYIPTSYEQFMKGTRTASENFKWIYAIKLKMENLPAAKSKGTVEAAVPSYELKEADGRTLLTVTLTSPTDDAAIYYNDGTNPAERSAQTKYEDPFTIDVTGKDLSANPIKYYTRTVREGYDDKGLQTMQYYLASPMFQNVSGGSPLGEDVVFTANANVTAEEWSAWTAQITKITLGYPDKTTKDLAAGQYQINNENKTIIVNKDLFQTTGNHPLTIEANGYATRTTTRTMKGAAPEIKTAAGGYPLYEDIVLTFDDPTQAYQEKITGKIDGKTVSADYLDRSEAGKLTIKASYFAGGAIKEPGEYTLVLSNTNYLPKDQTLQLKITPETAGKAPENKDGVYLLTDADDLFWFAKQVNAKGIKDIDARLTNNINLNNALWTPIGISTSIVYSGVFDGDGHQIIGLKVNSQNNHQGLFGQAKDAVIKNLTVSGQVNGAGWTGGIVGTASGTTIANCVNKATVQGTVDSGGIAGNATRNSVIENCSNEGTISGTQFVGGICGQSASTTYLRNCINYGMISGNDRVGGITGANAGIKDGISVILCVNKGDVSAEENNVGGISGYVQEPVSSCYNTGTILGKKSDSATGIGGIAGYVANTQVTNCYNIGSVRCSASDATTRIGSFVGFWLSNYSSAGNYYLKNDTLNGIGYCTYNEQAPDATESKTIDEMKSLAPALGDAYAADTYQINGGYPVLAWQSTVASENQTAANAVILQISTIGKVDAGDACRERIEAARQAFDRLTEVQQKLVSNKDALTAAEAAYETAVKELSDAKTAAKGELDSYKNPADYRDAQKAELTAAINTGKAAIDSAADIDAVNSAMAAAKAGLDKIKTDAQLTEEELAAAKTAAKGELDSYKNPADYRDAQKAELTAAINTGKAAIDSAADIDAVNSAMAAAKAAIDKIKTNAQLTAEELAAAKITAKNELDSYKNASDYRDAQKTELADAITAGKTAIDNAADIDAVDSALATAKTELDKIKTNAQLIAEEEKAVVNKIKSSTEKTISIELGESSGLSKTVLQAIKDSGKEVTFVKKENGRALYSWTFDGSELGDTDTIQDIDLNISFTTENKAAIDKLAGDKNSLYLSFAYQGELPAPVRITVYVGDKYKDGDTLNLYYFNEKTKQAEEIAAGLTVKDGYVSFTLIHMSDYFLTANKIGQNGISDGKENGAATGDRSSAAIWPLICGAGLVSAAYLLRRKRTS